jgi:hypothetical protein
MVKVIVICVYWFNAFLSVSNVSNASNGVITKLSRVIFRAYFLFNKNTYIFNTKVYNSILQFQNKVSDYPLLFLVFTTRNKYSLFIYFLWLCSPARAMASSLHEVS